MATKDKAIDAYIAKAGDFAKPILNHVRELAHKTCPNVEEKMKWSHPHFDYKGKTLFGIGAFKNHCGMGFWKGSLITNYKKAMTGRRSIKSIKDLPADKIFVDFIKQAMVLNEKGINVPAKPKSAERKELIVPDYFMKALKKNKAALEIFDKASYSFKKEYLEWITEAKTDETRSKRITTALEWIAEGKGRNWKYERK